MIYRNIVEGEFLERPNRFIAYVKVAGKTERVHVKNTGRCKELLQRGVTCYLEKSDKEGRSTGYDLIAVRKGTRLINMDSQAPNKVVGEFLKAGSLFPDVKSVKPETTYGNSRFDFYVETEKEKIFIEVKGVTLEKDDVVSFPDAPSERAVKHVEELIQAKQDGYRVFVFFVIQMRDVIAFCPNDETHAAFGEALRKAQDAGVEVLAYDCEVTPESLQIRQAVPTLICSDAEREEKNKKERNEKEKNEKERKEKAGKGKADKQKTDIEKNYKENDDDFKGKLRIGCLEDISNPLLKWYDKSKRVLPWREQATPYRVWVSEIMLQQTRVEAVKPYFERFMQALPDIEALSVAPEEELLKLWEGLGYYNRVRNMQKAAIQVMESYNGKMPEEYEELLKLSGIGSYTAGAISSIAYKKVRPAVDGNVLRVVTRLTADGGNISEAKVKAAIEEKLLGVMPPERPGDFNQAMMEIGACVCVPNGAPHCESCPLQTFCKAYHSDKVAEYPVKDKAKSRQVEKKSVLVILDEERVVIRKRENKGLLAGMYEFPNMEGYRSKKEVKEYLGQCGFQVLRITPLEESKHIFTHKEWHMKGYLVRVDELALPETGDYMVLREQSVYQGDRNASNTHFSSTDWISVSPDIVSERYPIPSAYRAYTKYLNIELGMKSIRKKEQSK